MATDLQSPSEPQVTTLVAGILEDAKALVKQQFALVRHELREDLQKAKEAALSMSAGAGLAFTGGLLLSFMLAHGLNWAFPAAPLWIWYGIVGGACVAVGVALLFAGKKKLETISPVP